MPSDIIHLIQYFISLNGGTDVNSGVKSLFVDKEITVHIAIACKHVKLDTEMNVLSTSENSVTG